MFCYPTVLCQLHHYELKIIRIKSPCLQVEHRYLHSATCLRQRQTLLVVQEGISTEATIEMNMCH